MKAYKRKPGSRAYRAWSETTMSKAVEAVKKKALSLRKASERYKIPLGTLSNKVKQKHGPKPGAPFVFSDAEEQSFVDHIVKVAEWGFPFDYMDMRLMAKHYLDKKGVIVKKFVNNTPSPEWADRFVKRHSALRVRICQNIKRARAEVSAQVVKNFFSNLADTIEAAGNPPESHIFNYDETNLSDNPGVKKCVFKRATKHPERIKDSTKTAISVMYCGSASGEMSPPYVVYKAENLWSTWTEDGPEGARYNRSKSGWFDSCTFADWYINHFTPHIRRMEGKKILIGDNLSSHFSQEVLKSAEENNVSFVCLPANSTHLLQPLDVAFYGPLKRNWRKILDEYKASGRKTGSTLSKDRFPTLLRKLQDKVGLISENLISGFEKCGIHPINAQRVLSQLPDGEPEDPNDSVSSAVIDVLKTMRGVDTDASKKPKRKKKLDVEPGKSISAKDLAEAGTVTYLCNMSFKSLFFMIQHFTVVVAELHWYMHMDYVFKCGISVSYQRLSIPIQCLSVLRCKNIYVSFLTD